MALFESTGFGKFASNKLRHEYRTTLIGLYNRTGGHFFDEDAMRFFNSEVEADVIAVEIYTDVPHYVFVTSEQFEGLDGSREPRKWTVRHWNGENRDIDDVGEFQQYADRQSAMDAAKAYAEGLVKA